jgi:sterol desaturase/sphingolipid hydroxylase (fatty acid hydroxylase superfamily)
MIAQIHLHGYILHVNEKKWQSVIVFIIFILQYLFEHFFPENKNNNSLKNERRNILIGILNIAILFIPSAFLVEFLSYTKAHHIGILHLFQMPLWINIFVTIVIMDLAMYWWHRINHTQHFFWRFHSFHHRDERMNTTTAVRFHIVELLFSTAFKAPFYLLIGFDFLPILIYEILFFMVVLVHHSNISITKKFDMEYRKLFSSPLMHRIHHSNIREETDTNYGSVFSFWDRIFNTYKKEANGVIVFGVDERKQ